jgi:CheY-like chemotaxis protein
LASVPWEAHRPVLVAADGRQAVETFRLHAEDIRLVLLDRTMPGASGEEALDAIRRISSRVPVLLVSGYSRESAQGQLEDDAHCAFLQKPFLPETLLEKVRELIAG